MRFEDGKEFTHFGSDLLYRGGAFGYDGITKLLTNVSLNLETSSWLSLCTQIDNVDKNLKFVANGELVYNGHHPGVKKFEPGKTVKTLTMMKQVNARIADLYLVTRKVSDNELIGFTSCKLELKNSQVDFRPGAFGLQGSDRRTDNGETLFVPRDFCSDEKLLFLPPHPFFVSAEMCKNYGKFIKFDNNISQSYFRWYNMVL